MNVERWKRFTLQQQMGHLTSEIVRARLWEDRLDHESRDRALERALELMDVTLQCYTKSRRRELARFREIIAHLLVRSGEYGVTLLEAEQFGLSFVLSQS